MRSILLAVFFLASFAATLYAPAIAGAPPTVVTKTVATGVTLTQELSINPPLIIDIVSADLSIHGVRVETAIGSDSITGGTGDVNHGTEQVEVLAARHGAVAAINGDFFSAGDPLGLLGYQTGEIYSEPHGKSIALRVEMNRMAEVSFLAYLHSPVA